MAPLIENRMVIAEGEAKPLYIILSSSSSLSLLLLFLLLRMFNRQYAANSAQSHRNRAALSPLFYIIACLNNLTFNEKKYEKQ